MTEPASASRYYFDCSQLLATLDNGFEWLLVESDQSNQIMAIRLDSDVPRQSVYYCSSLDTLSFSL